ncbi:uncharacterized protein F5Z01DRAFT_677411 [Emericellopsis atlantica]|uniref:Uncharacterized protein n=1 Tax=Emericellopsis atlantica TaxID=2614577 RepID=A0A9P7ZFC9_9HYPO|nr:uncharacterized protein F5Z01DRAFT_677411 [Emericellopsis atlantica]KAG9250916.1 hypothetical protein F5Z01DRAFT_677411 [Emericellopsis atlantica]
MISRTDESRESAANFPSVISEDFLKASIETDWSGHSARFGWHCGPIDIMNAPFNDDPCVSKVNAMVCMILGPSRRACGTCIEVDAGAEQLRQHMEQTHNTHLTALSLANTAEAEEATGQRSLIQFVITGRWRTMMFEKEPGVGPANGPLQKLCDFFESKARNDDVFACIWGRQFHRREEPVSVLGKRSRNADAPLPDLPSSKEADRPAP